MTEVILNDECMHCNNRECHDGEHFCNQAMKDNSFYKNSKLYKGLEVIQRPTYKELEKQIAELKFYNKKLLQSDIDKQNKIVLLSQKVNELQKANVDLNSECRRCVYSDTPCILSDYVKDKNGICDHFKDVFDENAELKSEKGCESCTKFAEVQLTKAKTYLKYFIEILKKLGVSKEQLVIEAEAFLNSEVEK